MSAGCQKSEDLSSDFSPLPVDGLDDDFGRYLAARADAYRGAAAHFLALADAAHRRRVARRRHRILAALELRGFPRGRISQRHERLSHLLGQVDAELAQ
jgi:hypothetical protein